MTAKSRGRNLCIGWIGLWLCFAMPLKADTNQAASSLSSTVGATESSVTALLEHQRFRAEQWGLDEIEWQRYQSLLQGIRGSVSPATLSPIEVLGIHARSAEERQRYAQQWAVLMREDAERILAFQRAYHDAQRRLFPNSVLIDPHAMASLTANQNPTESLAWQPDDRVLLFTDTQCLACDAVLERLLSQISRFSGIDLYLTDVATGEEARIREWAVAKQIDPRWVSEHRITLNIDAGALDQITTHLGRQGQDLPVLILRRGGQLMPLPVSRF